MPIQESVPTIRLTSRQVNIEAVRGDDLDIPFLFRSNGSVVSVADRTYTARAARENSNAPAVAFTIDASNAAVGIIIASLTRVQTAAMVGNQLWEIEQTDAAGKLLTIVSGTLILKDGLS